MESAQQFRNPQNHHEVVIVNNVSLYQFIVMI